MYGAIIGDIVGSRFEFNNIRSKDFKFFSEDCYYTDDSVMTIAVAKALHESKKNGYEDLSRQCIKWMREIGQRYPHCGYGGRFFGWINGNSEPEPYNSFGNGSAMRTSECAWIADSLEEALHLAEVCSAVSHNHPEGIKGAQATTACIYLAKEGKSKEEIRKYVEDNFYKLDFTIEDIKDTYRFNETCQGTVPQAIECFLEAESYEDAIRNCMWLGGDCDTSGAICGAIAEAYFGLPDGFIEKARDYLTVYLAGIIDSLDD